MNGCRSSVLVAGVLALAGSAGPAQAQLARTWVSSLGNDANDCNRLTPCRTFQRAHDNTYGGGEMVVLDPAGYGAVTITKSISIINDGVGEAGVLVSGDGTGITINAGTSDRVSLRGLTVKGIAFGDSNGIRFNSGASLSIENCAIRNNTGDGIQMLGNLPQGTKTTLTLSNTFVADNGGNGIYIQPTGTGRLSVFLKHVEIYSNAAHGFAMALLADVPGVILAMAVESVSANNGLAGFVTSNAGVNNNLADLRIIRSVAVRNGSYGAQGDGPSARIFHSENLMLQNGIADWTGVAFTYGDNVVGIGVAQHTDKQ